MMIKILFFGRLRELLKCSEYNLTDFGTGDVTALRKHLSQNGADWAEFITGNNALVAVNQEMVEETKIITTGDEVAFFPPVTGG